MNGKDTETLRPQTPSVREALHTVNPPAFEAFTWSAPRSSAPKTSPGLQVPEGGVIADPGVGGLGEGHKGVVLLELLRVAHKAVSHLGHLETVPVQLHVKEGDLKERERGEGEM